MLRSCMLAGLVFALASCGPAGEPAGPTLTGEPVTGVAIRVANESAFALDDVRIGFPQAEEEYGQIPANGVTEYRTVSNAYRYAAVWVTVGGEVISIHPIDYVGETPLSPGRYTYVVRVDETRTQLSLELRID